MISLREPDACEWITAEWISGLFEVGRRSRLYAENHPGQRLIVVMSVPTRMYAAVLVAAGWISKTPEVKDLSEEVSLGQLIPGETVRFVCGNHVVNDVYKRIEAGVPERAYFENECRILDKIKMVIRGEEGSPYCKGEFRSENIFVTSDFEKRALMNRVLSERYEVSIVGIRKSLFSQMELEIHSNRSGRTQTLESLLLTNLESKIGALTNVVSSLKIESLWDQARESDCLILDQPSAFSYLTDAESSIVFVIDDRAGIQNSALEDITQYFNWCVEVDLNKELSWLAPTGIEAFGLMVENG